MRAQIKTLLLMAAVLAAIVVYAVIPAEITLGSYMSRKITLAHLSRLHIEQTRQKRQPNGRLCR